MGTTSFYSIRSEAYQEFFSGHTAWEQLHSILPSVGTSWLIEEALIITSHTYGNTHLGKIEINDNFFSPIKECTPFNWVQVSIWVNLNDRCIEFFLE